MRVAAVFCSAILVLVATSAFAGAATRHARMARLAGTTKVESACPVPSHLCKSWRPLPNARFTVIRLNAAGKALARTARTVTSDAAAHFRIALRTGTYLVKPARGTSLNGGNARRVHLRPGITKTIVVRFAERVPSS